MEESIVVVLTYLCVLYWNKVYNLMFFVGSHDLTNTLHNKEISNNFYLDRYHSLCFYGIIFHLCL